MSLCLTIAGSDSCGGAGIQADLKTFCDLGAYGASAITAVTAQNRRGVTRIDAIPPEGVVAQIDAVFDDLPVQAVKIGMLGTAAHVAAVAAALRDRNVPVVLDPVMVATSGAILLEPDAIDALRDMLALATLATPNWPEAELLAQTRDPDGVLAWAESAPCAVLVKGGDGGPQPETVVRDVLFEPGKAPRIWEAERLPFSAHGTGCTLSSAIAVGLARGLSLAEAVDRGIGYIRFLLENSVGGLLPHGLDPEPRQSSLGQAMSALLSEMPGR